MTSAGPNDILPSAPPDLYFEDFPVGRQFTSGTLAVTADEIKAFAAQFDPQPFHLDEDAARRSPFGGLVASGWHTAALTMRLLVDGEIRMRSGVIGLGGELTWPRPVHAGDVLHVESRVLDAKRSRSKPDRGVVTVEHRTVNQRGETVQLAVMKILAPCRGP